MSITVQLMSGDVHTLEIFDGYRIVNTKNEIASILGVNRDLVTISQRQDNDEFDVLDDMDYAEDGKYYYAFVEAEQDPPEYFVKFDYDDDNFPVITIDEYGEVVNYIQKSAIVHVQISEYAWEFLRNVLRENKHGVMYDSENEYDDNDRYNMLSKEEVIDSYLKNYSCFRYSIGGSFEIVIHGEEDEEDYDPDNQDGDNDWE
jgi:hypothetical protein